MARKRPGATRPKEPEWLALLPSRVRPLFRRIKLPGWAVAILGIVSLVPDVASRFDFWMGILRDYGGSLSAMASIAASPYFALGLVVAGVLWLLFVGEPSRFVQRHPSLPYVGWTVFGVAFCLLVGTMGAGAIEAHIQQEIGRRETPGPARALTDEQRRVLRSYVEEFRSWKHPLHLTLGDGADSGDYAKQFKELFEEMKVRVVWAGSSRCLLAQRGVMVGVQDPKNRSPQADRFFAALKAAGVAPEYTHWEVDKYPDSLDFGLFICGQRGRR